MTMVMEEVQRRRPEDGPRLWLDAWDRALALVEPLWRGSPLYGDDRSYIDQTATLATALYLLAAERGQAPAEVIRADIEDLVYPEDGTAYPLGLPDRWSQGLVALGHDLQDVTDPVTAWWQPLAVDRGEPDEMFLDASDSLGPPVGHAATESMQSLLAPIYRDRFAF